VVVSKYKPNFSDIRHSIYQDGFDNCNNVLIYYKFLNKFLLDKNLSPYNQDDVELLKDLLFESKLKKVHLGYAMWMISWCKKNKTGTLIVSNYIRYISNLSILHMNDFWTILLVNRHKKFIEKLLNLGDSDVRLALVNAAVVLNPKLMKHIPKLKTYLLFS
jgi:hypothetical protein